MRKMTNGVSTINVVEHKITQNFWEYYVTDEEADGDIKFCLVMGFDTELGTVSMDEIAPYVRSTTTDLAEIMPADGWNWLEEAA